MPVPPEVYDREYFLSNYCEGHEEFESDRGVSAIKARQLEMLDLQPGLRVLDAGCGRGEVLLACARAGAQVAGIDYAEAAVQISRETLAGVPDAEVHHGSLVALPWPEAHFDRILFGDVIEHLDPEEAEQALSELRRVLKPDGLMLLHTSPNRLFRRLTWPLARPVLRLTGFRANADALDFWLREALRYHVNEQTVGSLRRSLRRAGFSARVWLDADITRGGGYHLTDGLHASPFARLAIRLAALRPLRLLLGNDIYALARPDR